jgi:hypothetical protein
MFESFNIIAKFEGFSCSIDGITKATQARGGRVTTWVLLAEEFSPCDVIRLDVVTDEDTKLLLYTVLLSDAYYLAANLFARICLMHPP